MKNFKSEYITIIATLIVASISMFAIVRRSNDLIAVILFSLSSLYAVVMSIILSALILKDKKNKKDKSSK